MALPTRLDHCVIHVTDWARSNAFYRDVLGAELVARPAGFAYRFGDKQLNVHGPGVKPAEVARLPVQPGNSDLCFEWNGPIDDAIAHLEIFQHGRAPVEAQALAPLIFRRLGFSFKLPAWRIGRNRERCLGLGARRCKEKAESELSKHRFSVGSGMPRSGMHDGHG